MEYPTPPVAGTSNYPAIDMVLEQNRKLLTLALENRNKTNKIQECIQLQQELHKNLVLIGLLANVDDKVVRKCLPPPAGMMVRVKQPHTMMQPSVNNGQPHTVQPQSYGFQQMQMPNHSLGNQGYFEQGPPQYSNQNFNYMQNSSYGIPQGSPMNGNIHAMQNTGASGSQSGGTVTYGLPTHMTHQNYSSQVNYMGQQGYTTSMNTPQQSSYPIQHQQPGTSTSTAAPINPLYQHYQPNSQGMSNNTQNWVYPQPPGNRIPPARYPVQPQQHGYPSTVSQNYYNQQPKTKK